MSFFFKTIPSLRNDTKDSPENWNNPKLKIENNHFDINSHNNIMNETDRTIVGLLWHENIVDVLGKVPIKESFPFYNNILENIILAHLKLLQDWQKNISTT